MLTKIGMSQLARAFLSTMCILMFIGFIHLLSMEEEEDQMMVRELLFADSSQRIQQLMVRLSSIF